MFSSCTPAVDDVPRIHDRCLACSPNQGEKSQSVFLASFAIFVVVVFFVGFFVTSVVGLFGDNFTDY